MRFLKSVLSLLFPLALSATTSGCAGDVVIDDLDPGQPLDPDGSGAGGAGDVIQGGDVSATAHLEAVADAAVYGEHFDDNGDDTNFGSISSLWFNEGIPSQIFLRFDLRSVPSNVNVLSVRLEMTAHHSEYGDSVDTRLVLNDTWDEYGITWNNQPPIEDKVLGSWSVGILSRSAKLCVNDHELLIAPVQEALASDQLISFRLDSTCCDSDYYSREWDDVTKRPQLVVEYEEEP
ncbi:CBM96 family carbohydrate-binding protein [Sorangium sp. So ce128]|uniref:CBM96 family carbohydrate-binding protein n=1 Tax=Sorangium sp. So ce128 TaxID=3133281 RepID=UPI003F61843D